MCFLFAILQMKLQKLIKHKITTKLDVSKLRKTFLLKQQFKEEVQHCHKALENECTTPDEWTTFCDTIIQGAKKIIQTIKKVKRK